MPWWRVSSIFGLSPNALEASKLRSEISFENIHSKSVVRKMSFENFVFGHCCSEMSFRKFFVGRFRTTISFGDFHSEIVVRKNVIRELSFGNSCLEISFHNFPLKRFVRKFRSIISIRTFMAEMSSCMKSLFEISSCTT